MAKKIELKTSKNNASVAAYLNGIEPAAARRDAKQLAKLFKETTGVKPKMWGNSIVGYGEYTYYRANGAEGQYMACGFSNRKSGPTLYIMPGYQDYGHLLEKIGPHKLGKSCLYLKSLDDIDQKALARLIRQGLKDLKKTHSVTL
ncbi:MAG: DUF1801 domain-containing protein [Pseudomonadota bacterium]